MPVIVTTPVVSATPDKTTYRKGEQVTVTFTVDDAPATTSQTRVIEWAGRDGEGHQVTGTLTITTETTGPDPFTLDWVRWADTRLTFTVDGLTATSVA